MSLSKPTLGIAPSVALIGGGGLFVASLFALLGSWGPFASLQFVSLGAFGALGSFVPRSSVQSVALLVGYVVLANGLSGRPGAFGPRRLVRFALIGSGVAGLVVAASSWPNFDEATLFSPGFRVYTVVFDVVAALGVVLLVVAALAVTRPAGRPAVASDAVLGLRVLAVVAVVDALFELAVQLVGPLLPTDALLGWFVVFDWEARLVSLAGVAVGVWFAWPWLAPRFRALRAAVSRVAASHRDSTP